MKQISLIFILSFFLQNIFGQVLTKEEAYAFADKLWEMEILSERGRNMLKMKIDLNKDGYQPMDVESLNVTGVSVKKEISNLYILDFLHFAFQNETRFRMGEEEHDKIAKKYIEEKGERQLTEKDIENIHKIFFEKITDFEGWKIEEKIISEDSILENSGYTWKMNIWQKIEKRLVHSSRSVTGKTRSRTAKDLFEIGLVNRKVYDETIKKIRAKELKTEMDIIDYAKFQLQFYETLPTLKEEELKILDNLKQVGLLSEVNFQELIHPKNAERELSRFEIFSKCENAKVLKNDICTSKPFTCFQNAFAEIKSLIPDLDYKNFDYRIDERSFEWDKDLLFLESKIQMDLDGKTYRSSSMQGSYNKKEDPNWTLDSLEINYQSSAINMVNKILTNRNSSMRLYSVFEKSTDFRKKRAILLMTQNQFKAWNDPYGMHFYSEDHNNFFTIDKVNELIDEYKLIGLFDHLTKDEIEEGIIKVHEGNIYSHVDILMQFSNVIIDFDWEYHNLTNPYEELTTKFAKSSKGNFKPENIKDDFSKNYEKAETTFSFEVLGKKYQREFRMMGDWLDHRFISLINDAIKDSQVDGKFYDCIDDAQYDGYIFLTKRQYDFLKKEQPKFFYKNNSHD